MFHNITKNDTMFPELVKIDDAGSQLSKVVKCQISVDVGFIQLCFMS